MSGMHLHTVENGMHPHPAFLRKWYAFAYRIFFSRYASASRKDPLTVCIRIPLRRTYRKIVKKDSLYKADERKLCLSTTLLRAGQQRETDGQRER